MSQADGSILIDTKVDNSGLSAGMVALGNLASAAITKATSAINSGIKFVANVGKDFDTAMSQLGATMGKTVDQIDNLKAKAEQMGRTTKFTATEAAEGLNILAQSGLSAQEQIDGIETVLNLASAGAMDMATAAGYVTTTVKGFSDSMNRARYYADLMAKGATLANTSVNELGRAFSETAATSNAYHQSAEGTTLALLRMAEGGITGSEAATGLKRAMQLVYAPTETAAKAIKELGVSAYDSTGKERDFNEVIADLQTALAGCTNEQRNHYTETIFGARGMSVYNAMIATGTDTVERFTDGIAHASDGIGAASEQAATQIDNLEGDITIMRSALEGVGIAAYNNFRDPLRAAVQSVTEALGSADVAGIVDGISSKIGDLATRLASRIPDVIRTVTNALGWVVDNIDLIVTGIKTFLITWAAVKALSIITSIISAVGAIGKVIAGLISGTTAMGGFTVACGSSSAALASATAGISLLVTGLVVGIKALVDWSNRTYEFNNATLDAAKASTGFENGLKNLQPSLAGTKDLLSSTGQSMETLNSKISEAEKKITQMMYDESGKRRELRADEIQNIKDYQDEILRLKQEQLEIMRQQQEIELLQLQRKLEKEGQLTQEAAAQALVDANAAYSESLKALDEAYNAEYARTYAYYKELGQLESQEAQDALTRLDDWRDAEEQKNKEARDATIKIAADEAKQWIALDKEKFEKISNARQMSGDEYRELLNGMNMETTKAFLQMVASARDAGVELDDETKEMAANILNTFYKMPPSMSESGKQLVEGLVGGMEQYFPSLRDTSNMTCQEILTTLWEGFDMHSPSKKTKQMGVYLAEGLALGLEEQGGSVRKRAKVFADGLTEIIGSAVNAVTSTAENAWNNTKTALSNTWDGINSKASTVWSNVTSTISTAVSSAKDKAVDLWEKAKTKVSIIWDGVNSTASTVWNSITGSISSATSSVTSKATELWNSAKSSVSNIWDSIKSNASSAWNGITETVSSIFGKLPSSIKSIGGNLISGLWNGISDKASWLWDKVSGFGNKLLSGIKGIFGISSPSKVMRFLIGRNIGIGFAMGIEDEQPMVEKSMRNLMSPDTVSEYGSQLRSAVNDQSANVGHAATSTASSQTAAISADMPTATDIARAIWNEAPELGMNIDGERAGSILEPIVSRIQGQKTTNLNRRAGLATV